MEKTLMLGKTEGRRRRGRQRMRWLDGITASMDMNLSKLGENSESQGSLACCSPWGCKESDVTERLNKTKACDSTCLCSEPQIKLPETISTMLYEPQVYGSSGNNCQGFNNTLILKGAFPGGSVIKNQLASAGDMVWSLGWEDPLQKEMAYSIQCSCLENHVDRGAWQARVHGFTKNQT